MRARHERRGERGAVAVFVALLIVVLAMFLGLVINTGHLHLVRSELQNAVDAAALAAARELNGMQSGIDAATEQAVAFAARHETDAGMPVVIDRDVDVVFGYWDHAAPRESAFTPIWLRDEVSLVWINAVQVRAGREASRGNAVDVKMAGLFGRETADVPAEAVAVLGGPCNEGCSLPIAFPKCMVVEPNGSLRCDEILEFADANEDNIGFTSLSTRPASIAEIRNILNTGECRSVDVGDPINIQNGNGVNPVYQALSRYVGQRVTAPIIDIPCPPQFNQQHTVIGFASFTFLEVQGPPQNILRIRLDCGQVLPRPANAGCQFFGTTPIKPRLVR